MTGTDFSTFFSDQLRDPNLADAYLRVVLDEKNLDEFLKALKDVAQAQGGFVPYVYERRQSKFQEFAEGDCEPGVPGEGGDFSFPTLRNSGLAESYRPHRFFTRLRQ